MSEQDIKQWVAEYGVDPTKWPDRIQSHYQQLLARQPMLSDVADEEAAFWKNLQQLDQPTTSAGFSDNILAAAFAKPQEEHLSLRVRITSLIGEVIQSLQIPRPALTAVILLLIGIMGGFEFSPAVTDTSEYSLNDLYYMERELL